MNLFADFLKFFKCRLFNKIPGNLQKMFVNNDPSQNRSNWIRLIIFDDNSSFVFSQSVPKQLLIVL